MLSQPHRIPGHLRRHGIAYAALTVAFSFSPVPSMAADLVTTGEIANGAVTRPKLADDSVVSGKIVNESVVGPDIKNGSITRSEVANLDWHDLNLMNGWQVYSGTESREAGWAIDAQGIVHLRGAIFGGTQFTFAVLPPEVRPSANLRLHTRAGNTVGMLGIYPQGDMVINTNDSAAYGLTNLDGITWAR